MSEIISKRLFIGGLAADVSSDEVVDRFSRFGQVSNVSLKIRRDGEGNPIKSFAHLNIEGDETNLKKCFSTYQNTKWKGSVLKLQYAKESFLDKLEKERQGDQETAKEIPVQQPTPDNSKPLTDLFEIKGPAVPGTPVPDKKDWIIGKYGRVLPVLKLKKSYKIKMVKHDPSKYCHTAKIFKDEATDVPPCDKLTWEINTPDTAITKKRKGEFPVSTPSSKKRNEGPSPLQSQKLTKIDQPTSHSVKDSWTNKSHANENEKFEVVKIGYAPNINTPKPVTISNKFDSDIESDSAEGPVNGDIASNRKKVVKERKSPAIDKIKGKGKKKCVVQDDTGDEDEKIPEFKGLQVLGLVSKASNSSSKHTDKDSQLKNDIINSQFENTSPSKVNKNLNHSNSQSNTSPPSNKSLSYSDSGFRAIPEFRGLSMLSDVDTVSNSTVTETQTVTPKSSELKENPTHTPDVSLIKSFKKSEAEGQRKTRTTVSPKAVVKSKNNNNSSSDLSMAVSDGFESASSADTDEIIARYKEKQVNGWKQNSSSLDTPKTFLKTSTPLPHLKHTSASSDRDKKNPLLDQSWYLSEFTAGTPEISNYSLPNTTVISENNADDSNDSDLDSNNFELVAKKLAQKAAMSTKALKGQSSKGESMSVGKRLSQEPKQPKMTGGEKKDQAEGRTGVQAKLLGIASGSIASVEENKKLSQDAKRKSPEKKVDKSARLQDKADPKSKQVTDNEKRLLALKDKQKQRQQQQNLMQKALKNVDSQDVSSTKRIVFSSSEDSDGSDNDSSENEQASKTEIVSKASREIKGKKTLQAKDKLALFESSSEDESDDGNYDDMFESKPHFEGKKGEKLMKLQKKIGDSRFKVDAKFAESDSEDEEREKVEGGREDKEVNKSLEEEKAANLKVLENVVGKSTLDRFSAKIKRNTKHMIDMNAVRFDPTKMVPEAETPSKIVERKKPSNLKSANDDVNISSQFKVMPKEDRKSQKNVDDKRMKTDSVEDRTEKLKKIEKKTKVGDAKTKTEKMEDTNSSSVTPKSRVQMSSSLLNLFKTKQNDDDEAEEVEDGTFSLMKQFDTIEKEEESSDNEAESDSEEEEVVKKKDKPAAPLSGLFKKTEKVQPVPGTSQPKCSMTDNDPDSSSDEEGDKNDTEARQSQTEGENDNDDESDEDEDTDSEDEEMLSDANVTTKNNPDIEQELLNAGKVDVRYTKEQWHQRWEDIRPTILKVYKRKHKDALKNKRAHNEKKRRREFLKNSKKGMWSRRKR